MSNLPRSAAERKPELVFLTIRYDPRKRKQLKVLAARTGTSVTAIVTEAIRRYVFGGGEAPRMSIGGAPN